jgi:hypothetical protein
VQNIDNDLKFKTSGWGSVQSSKVKVVQSSKFQVSEPQRVQNLDKLVLPNDQMSFDVQFLRAL